MAFAAHHGPVRSQQRELRLRVIEPIDVRPGLHGVTHFAAKRRPIRAPPRHPVFELPLVRVRVTRRAGAVFKFERQDLVGPPAGADLMTITASHGHVRSRQGKPASSMLRNRVCAPMEIHHRVTRLALIVVGCGGELIVVRILVAVAASRELYLVNRVLARRNVALRALHSNVLALQRVPRTVMLLHSKERRFPAIHGMTLRAFALLRAGFKLSLVRIRLVAIVAIRKYKLLLEITIDMASHAGYLDVLSRQRILRLRVIEVKSSQHRFPTVSRVARFAGFLELPPVRINVTRRAGVELHVPITRRPARRIRLVALFACHLCV